MAVRVAIIKASELGNRWDAGFHIALKEHQADVEKLEKAGTAKLLAAVTSIGYLKEAWDVVGKGNYRDSRSFASSKGRMTDREMALYIALASANQAAKIDQEIADLQAKRQRLTDSLTKLEKA